MVKQGQPEFALWGPTRLETAETTTLDLMNPPLEDSPKDNKQNTTKMHDIWPPSY